MIQHGLMVGLRLAIILTIQLKSPLNSSTPCTLMSQFLTVSHYIELIKQPTIMPKHILIGCYQYSTSLIGCSDQVSFPDNNKQITNTGAGRIHFQIIRHDRDPRTGFGNVTSFVREDV